MHAESQSAVNTLQKLFLGEEDPDSTAKTIATLYKPSLQQRSQSIFELWEIICDAVGVLGCHLLVEERLVKFINALSELPGVTDQSGVAVKPGDSWFGFGVFWRDLPVLAFAYREAPDGFGINTINTCCYVALKTIHAPSKRRR